MNILKLLNRTAVALIFTLPPAALADDLPTFRLTAKNGHFSPETIAVPAGKKFRIVIKNEGSTPEEFESIELRKETVLAAGVTRAVVFAPMKPGTYKFFGDFHPDTAKGQIVVK
ncbi:MAG: cupredoxin domain-containing protein [Gallionellaceae bacterium]|nr:cupredoxin domain-containing protein [Gallionellaceae bacterium]